MYERLNGIVVDIKQEKKILWKKERPMGTGVIYIWKMDEGSNQ